MARHFTAASSMSMAKTGVANLGPPLTLACWLKLDTVADFMMLMSRSDAGGTNLARMFIDSQGYLYAQSYDGAAAPSALYNATRMSTGFWQHCAAVFASASSRKVYVNGSVASDTTTSTATGMNALYVGAQANASLYYLDGAIDQPAEWSAALTDDEIAALASGYSPLLVRPSSLVGHWPFYGLATNEEDWVGSSALVPTNSPTYVEGPKIIYPRRGHVLLPAATATGGGPLIYGSLTKGALIRGGRLAA